MATTNATSWSIEAHTKAKHDILQRYLSAWFPIFGQTGTPMVYIDGFSGPGQYSGGEEGSPLLALRVAQQARMPSAPSVAFWFIEKRKSRFDQLAASIPPKEQLPPNFTVYLRHGAFEDVSDEIDKEVCAASHPPAIFAFIDPFGFSGIKMSVIHRYLRYQQSEVLINVMQSRINRWIGHPKSTIRDHIVEVFGSTEVLDVPSATNGSNDRVRVLREIYQRALASHAKFIRPFAMHGRDGRLIYDLVFAGNHPKGFIRMKEAMWKVDDSGSFSFSGATAQQMRLFDDDPTAAIVEALVEKFAGRARVDASEVENWVAEDTWYLDRHKTAALKQAEEDRLINVHAHKCDGTPRRARTFPKGTLIDFPHRS